LSLEPHDDAEVMSRTSDLRQSERKQMIDAFHEPIEQSHNGGGFQHIVVVVVERVGKI